MKRDIFWYKQPAGVWIEALPLGNGRMGAMVYGDTREETIQIDESSFWSGERSEHNNRDDSYELMWKIRRALLEEDYEEADRLGHDFVGYKNQYGTNMPVGNLKLAVQNLEQEACEYERSISLSEGIAKTSFTLGTAHFERETFVSNPAQCAVVRMGSDEAFSLGIRYEGIGNGTRIQGELPQTAQKAQWAAPGDSDSDASGALFRIAGEARETLHSNGNCGAHLEGALLLKTDGCVRSFKNCVHVEGCRQVILYIDLETDMFLQDPAALACRRVLEAGKKGYECLKKEHIADVKPLYERMSLSLGGEEKSELPTDVRIEKVKAGEKDPDLYRMMFDFGRYLLIASSRPDSPLPTHMGGPCGDQSLGLYLPWMGL